MSTKETESVLEVKRLWGVESVFSPATNDYGARIHKWTWRGGGFGQEVRDFSQFLNSACRNWKGSEGRTQPYKLNKRN